MIRCRCGNVKFDGTYLKGISIAEFRQGHVNMKCKTCKFWMNGINAKLFTGEIQGDIDFRETNGNSLQEIKENDYARH